MAGLHLKQGGQVREDGVETSQRLFTLESETPGRCQDVTFEGVHRGV